MVIFQKFLQASSLEKIDCLKMSYLFSIVVLHIYDSLILFFHLDITSLVMYVFILIHENGYMLKKATAVHKAKGGCVNLVNTAAKLRH